MKKEKIILKQIEATVMPQTKEALQLLMKQTGLTIGEVIDRLTLHICPDKLEQAVLLAEEQVYFSISNLPKGQVENALEELILFWSEFLPTDQLRGLEQKVIANRPKIIEQFRKGLDRLPAEEVARLEKKLSALEEIGG